MVLDVTNITARDDLKLHLAEICTWFNDFFVVGRSAQGTWRSALYSKGLKGLQTGLMEEVGTGQKHRLSVLMMAGCTCFCQEARAAQCSQADGAVPDASLDNLSEVETVYILWVTLSILIKKYMYFFMLIRDLYEWLYPCHFITKKSEPKCWQLADRFDQTRGDNMFISDPYKNKAKHTHSSAND